MQIRQIHARDPACQSARAPREGASCSKPWGIPCFRTLRLAQHDTEQGSAGLQARTMGATATELNAAFPGEPVKSALA